MKTVELNCSSIGPVVEFTGYLMTLLVLQRAHSFVWNRKMVTNINKVLEI